MTEQETAPEDIECPEEVTQLHEIAVFLAACLEESAEEDELFKPLHEDAIKEIDTYLEDLAAQEDNMDEFIHCVHTIAAFVHGNGEESPRMGAQVKAVLNRPHVVEKVKKWSVSADPESVKAVADRFGDFAGIKSDRKAPGVGDEKPEGAVDLNSLNFPKRL